MSQFSDIKAVAFDADGTLWDFDKVMRDSLHLTLQELRRLDAQAAAKLTVDAIIEIREETTRELEGTVIDLEKMRHESFRRTLQHVGRGNDQLASHLTRFYLKHRYEDITLYDDVLPTLEHLRRKYKVGLLTNGNTDPERCGLSGYFEFTVFATAHGVAKPDQRIFEIAVGQAGCATHEMVYIGDSLKNDVAGANSAGLKSIWLNRERDQNSTFIAPDLEIASLAELVEIL